MVNNDVGVEEAEAEDLVDDEDQETDLPPARVKTADKPRRRRIGIVVGVVVVVLAAVVAAILVVAGSGSPANRTFVDSKDGFKITYPSSWVSTKSSDSTVPLLLTFGAHGLDTLLVRVIPLQTTVDVTNLSDIQSVTDAIISGTNVNVTKHQGVTLNGMLGYWYVYDFTDSNTHLIHNHFFIFQPNEAVSLVFQTTDADKNLYVNQIAHVLASFNRVPRR